MSEEKIQEYIDKYTHFRDNNEIVEEVVKRDSIEIKLKNKEVITFPKNVELHRFIIIGRRGPVAESKQKNSPNNKNTVFVNKLNI